MAALGYFQETSPEEFERIKEKEHEAKRLMKIKCGHIAKLSEVFNGMLYDRPLSTDMRIFFHANSLSVSESGSSYADLILLEIPEEKPDEVHLTRNYNMLNVWHRSEDLGRFHVDSKESMTRFVFDHLVECFNENCDHPDRLHLIRAHKSEIVDHALSGVDLPEAIQKEMAKAAKNRVAEENLFNHGYRTASPVKLFFLKHVFG